MPTYAQGGRHLSEWRLTAPVKINWATQTPVFIENYVLISRKIYRHPNTTPPLHRHHPLYRRKYKAIADLIWFAFFFILAPTEYCNIALNNLSVPVSSKHLLSITTTSAAAPSPLHLPNSTNTTLSASPLPTRKIALKAKKLVMAFPNIH